MGERLKPYREGDIQGWLTTRYLGLSQVRILLNAITSPHGAAPPTIMSGHLAPEVGGGHAGCAGNAPPGPCCPSQTRR